MKPSLGMGFGAGGGRAATGAVAPGMQARCTAPTGAVGGDGSSPKLHRHPPGHAPKVQTSL